MVSRETAIQSVQDLIDTYTQKTEGRTKQIEVSHEGFGQLPKDTRKLIEAVLKEVYRSDFEIIRKAFIEKLEFFLRLVANALDEANCIDTKLQTKIGTTREQIAAVVNEVEVSDKDIRWLKKIGFLPVDIFELTVKLNMPGVIAELRENIDEYKLILGDTKYIIKILKRHQGLEKLKRLRSFCKNYDSDVVKFNGYHLAQIVVNAGWEEKLNVVLSGSCLALLTGGSLTHNKSTKLLNKKNWKIQFRDLGVIS